MSQTKNVDIPPQLGKAMLGAPLQNGYIDWIDLVAHNVLRIVGWSTSDPSSEISVSAAGEPCAPLNTFRAYRPDVATHLGNDNGFLGFGTEYCLPTGMNVPLEILACDRLVYSGRFSVPQQLGPRGALLNQAVLTREQVYPDTQEVVKKGWPYPEPEAELLAMLSICPTPILDFGCGSGRLVRFLRERGQDARGLDLSEIEEVIDPQARAFVTVYDGALPAPIPSLSFPTVVCAEVLEHLKAYEDAISELARISTDRVVISVPDNGILSTCEPLHLIPWHYLTGDHYAFFNQASLEKTLRPHFSRIEIFRTTSFAIEGVQVYSNLLAVCYK
jgi:SAM-dependent methyltransferase